MEARNLPSPGIFHKISELRHIPDDKLHEVSVRVIGRLKERNPAQCRAFVYEDRKQDCLEVDTALIEPFHATTGSVVQFIGEMEVTSQARTLRARVVRMLDGVDLTVYHRAMEAQRRYLESRVEDDDSAADANADSAIEDEDDFYSIS